MNKISNILVKLKIRWFENQDWTRMNTNNEKSLKIWKRFFRTSNLGFMFPAIWLSILFLLNWIKKSDDTTVWPFLHAQYYTLFFSLELYLKWSKKWWPWHKVKSWVKSDGQSQDWWSLRVNYTGSGPEVNSISRYIR